MELTISIHNMYLESHQTFPFLFRKVPKVLILRFNSTPTNKHLANNIVLKKEKNMKKIVLLLLYPVIVLGMENQVGNRSGNTVGAH